VAQAEEAGGGEASAGDSPPRGRTMTRCSTCGKPSAMSDLDLAPIARTEANLWKSRYFEAWRELQKANRGLRRLAMKIQRLKSKGERE